MLDRLELALRRAHEASGRWLDRREPEASPPPPIVVGGLAVYMHPVELSQLLAIVHALGPRRCVEWGSGGSTLAILDAAPRIERYVSIEHDPAWHGRVASLARDPRLSLHLVEPDEALTLKAPSREQVIAWEATAEQDEAVMQRYVRFAASLGGAFDFALVDGRARRFCLATGYELLRPGGVVVLHDAQRPQYHDALAALGPRPVFLEPWHQGQIALVRKPD